MPTNTSKAKHLYVPHIERATDGFSWEKKGLHPDDYRKGDANMSLEELEKLKSEWFYIAKRSQLYEIVYPIAVLGNKPEYLQGTYEEYTRRIDIHEFLSEPKKKVDLTLLFRMAHGFDNHQLTVTGFSGKNMVSKCLLMFSITNESSGLEVNEFQPGAWLTKLEDIKLHVEKETDKKRESDREIVRNQLLKSMGIGEDCPWGNLEFPIENRRTA